MRLADIASQLAGFAYDLLRASERLEAHPEDRQAQTEFLRALRSDPRELRHSLYVQAVVDSAATAAEAAEVLGVSRTKLYEIVQQYGLTRPGRRPGRRQAGVPSWT